MMNISFVVPVLNGEKHIRRCLDSILLEMTEADEVIVIDNGSTDGTVDIIKNFKNVKLHVKPDLTVAALRNKGELETCNELLAFIDADCVLCEGWRQQVIETLADESIHATGSRYDIPEDACWIEKVWYSQKAGQKRYAKYINSGNLIVRRDIFNELSGFDETLVSDEDCDFGRRLNKAGYIMLEDPDVRAIHLGNPKSLKAFYLKEAWHATSVLASKSSVMFNRPTIMSILFGVTVLASLVSLVASVWVGASILWISLSVLLMPLVTAIYRAYQFRIYRYVPELTLLWSIFYLVRLNNMRGQLFSNKDC